MNKFVAYTSSINTLLRDQSKPWTQYFELAEKKTGVDRLYVFLGGVTFFALYLVLGIGQQLISNVIGIMYPAYCSVKALETPRVEDDMKWLTYWVVFAVFTIAESFTDFIISFIPFYWLIKCFFLAWLMAPTDYNGSLFLYRKFIRPKFIQYEPNVDDLIQTTRDAAIRAAEHLTNKRD